MRAFPFIKFLLGFTFPVLLVAGNACFAASSALTNFAPTPIVPATGQSMSADVVASQTVGGVGAPPGAFGVTPAASPVSFNPYTGNVSRVVTDIKVPAVGEVGLEFKRYYHSRPNVDANDNVIGSTILGSGGNWRHNYEWDFSFVGSNIQVVYPEGTVVLFSPNSSNTIYRYQGTSTSNPVTDFIVSIGTVSSPQYKLVRANNQAYYFAETTTASIQTYCLNKIVDSKGNTTTLTWEGGQIFRVAEPSGNFLRFEYSNGNLGGTQGMQPFLTKVITSYSPGIWVSFTYKSVPLTSPPKAYSNFLNLTTTTYDNTVEELTASYAYQMPPNTANANQTTTNGYSVAGNLVYPELISAVDIHADGPRSVAFSYTPNDTLQCGSVKTISDYASGSVGVTWESIDPNPGGQYMAGVIYTNSLAGSTNTNEYLYTVDAQGQVTAITDKDSLNNVQETCLTQYSVNASTGNVTTTNTDANGNATTTVRLSTGQVTQITYPPVGSEATTHTENWAYSTDANNYTYLTSHTNCPTAAFPAGNTTNYSYSINALSSQFPQLLTKITYPDTTTDLYAYGKAGVLPVNLLTSHTRRNGKTELFTYHPTFGLILSETDAAGNKTTYTYASNRVLTAINNANGFETTFAYTDKAGGPASGTSTILQVHSPTSKISAAEYNVYGQLIVAQDLALNVTTYTYDDLGRVATVIGPGLYGPLTVAYTYNFANNSSSPDKIQYSNGITKVTSNEMLWGYMPLSITMGAGSDASTNRMVYDNMGNCTQMIDPKSNVTLIGYDQRNRKDSVTDPAGSTTTYAYDDNNCILTETSLAAFVANTYDSMGRMATCTVKNSLQTVTYQSTSYAYDSEGKLQKYFDPNNGEYQYAYDQDERMTSMTYPDASTETNTYTGVHLTEFKTRDNRTETFSGFTYFDAPGKITWKTSSGAADTQDSLAFSYDAAQRVTAVANGNSTVSYAYNPNNQVLAESQIPPGWATAKAQQVDYSYYSGDTTLGTVTYPDGTNLDYGYGSRDELESVSIPNGRGGITTVQYGYDAANCISKTLLNGVTSAYGYDSTERLTSVTDTTASNQTLQSFNYGYDSVSRVQYVKRANGLGDVYTYDPSNQLTNVEYNATNPGTTPASPSRTVGYTFDAAGNRTQVVDSVAGTTNYVPNSDNTKNQYTQVGSSGVTYNTAGSLSSYAGWNYTYDAYGRLTQASNSGTGVEADYKYDPLGRCVASYSKATNITTYYIYGYGWSVIEEFTASGEFPTKPTVTETQRYLLGGRTDEIVSKTSVATNTTVYYNYDGSGNVSKLTDGSGNVLEQYSYDIYGAPTISNASGTVLTGTQYGNRYLYSGREYDTTTTLYHYRNREYSPVLGRFLQPDPSGHAGDGNNLYRFCGNDPVNNSDPSGLSGFFGFSLGGSPGSNGSQNTGGGDDTDNGSANGGGATFGLPDFDAGDTISVNGMTIDSYGIVTGNQITYSVPDPKPTPSAGALVLSAQGSALELAYLPPIKMERGYHYPPTGTDNTPYFSILMGFETAPLLFTGVGEVLDGGAVAADALAGGGTDCVNAAISTDRNLGGLANTFEQGGAPRLLTDVEDELNTTLTPVNGQAAISQQLGALGDGAKGIVGGYSEENGMWHVFNAYNNGGEIMFIDNSTSGTFFNGLGNLHFGVTP
jgi:RHS repeat-associated protein